MFAIRKLIIRTELINNCAFIFSRQSSQARILNMGDPTRNIKTGLPLSQVINKLVEIAPLKLAESWDNVGLLIEPQSDPVIKNILLTIDVDQRTLKEAVSSHAELIIAYHPLIFRGITSVSQRSAKERVILELIKRGISVFSPHTSWDAMTNGVNDWLISHLDFSESKPIIPNAENPSIGMGRVVTLTNPLTLGDIIEKTKQHCCIPDVRLGLSNGKSLTDKINTIAVCAGSGSSVLKGVSADLYISGEMSHHDVLEATQNNVSVILTNHSNSERGFLQFFVNNFNVSDKVSLYVESGAEDPLKTI